MKFLITGLGNPGDQYVDTRHNIGFRVVDTLAARVGVAFEAGRYGSVSSIRHRGHQLILLKPQTFMNLSGKAVRYWMQAEKIPIENVLVVVDDIALPFGKIRIRQRGSDGGHNGLHDIIYTLNADTFPRMRIGVGGDFPRGMQVDYVLGRWTPDEQSALPEVLTRASDAVLSFAAQGIERTMNTYNSK